MVLKFLFFLFSLGMISIGWLGTSRKEVSHLPPSVSQDESPTIVSAPEKVPPPKIPAPKNASGKSGTPKPLEVPDESERLLANWNFTDIGLSKNDLAPFFSESQPESIVYFNHEGSKRIYPNRYEVGGAQSEKTLFLGNKDSIKKVVKEREERAYAMAQPPQVSRESFRKIPGNAYEIVFYKPGTRDNGDPLKPVAEDLLAAIQGPDFSLAAFDHSDDTKMHAHMLTVLPLGHGGEILLKVKGNGFVSDEPGFDFSIFQTSFRIVPNANIFWQKFAYVGVSETSAPESFRWFDCDPFKGNLHGCAGVVPTSEGADHFDLAALGLKKIKFIWIKDIGKNKNLPSKWPTEGFALDALRLNHGYTKK